MHMCRGQERASGIVLLCSLPYSLETSNLELGWVANKPSWSCLSHPRDMVLGACEWLCPSFYVGSVDLNSSSDQCSKSSYLMSQSEFYQDYLNIFKVYYNPLNSFLILRIPDELTYFIVPTPIYIVWYDYWRVQKFFWGWSLSRWEIWDTDQKMN